MNISLIIATLNEAETIEKTLNTLSRLVNVSEIIIVDGGSTDGTIKLVEDFEKIKALRLIHSDKASRGIQLNSGAKDAEGEILWFVNADSQPIQGSGKQIKRFMNYSEIVGGNFQIHFSGKGVWARFLTWLYPHLMSAGITYGDSAFFARKSDFEAIGGFKDFPIFEDVDFYKRIRKRGRFVTIKLPVTISSTRLGERSFIWRFLKRSFLQALYSLGVSPRRLGKPAD